MKKILYLIFISNILLYSCTKKDNTATANNALGNYSSAIQLNKGSYWVYDNGDSVWMSNDTVIKGITYRIRRATRLPEELLRDSSGFIISYNEGDYIFSATKLKDTIWKMGSNYSVMTSPNTMITVPAGTFKSVANRCDFSITFYQFTERDYSPGIGIIRQKIDFETGGAPGGKIWEEKLVRYKIQ